MESVKPPPDPSIFDGPEYLNGFKAGALSALQAQNGHDAVRQSAYTSAPDSGTAGLLGWQIRTAHDALQRFDPLPYLVDSLLPYPSLSIFYGAPGSLKSMILADLAVCVAGGLRWLEQLPGDDGKAGVTLATTQAPVLWCDFDNGKRRTATRLGAILRAHGLSADTPLDYVSMPVPSLDASNQILMDAFTAIVSENEYRLVICDNLGLVTGSAEENSSQMANVMGRFRQLAERADAAVVLIHHQRKSGTSGASDGIRKGETLRGHSSIEASLDLAMLVERQAGTDKIIMLPTKVRDYLSFSAIGAHFAYDHFDGTRDLEGARFYSAAVEGKGDKATEMLRALILACVKAQPGINGKALAATVTEDAAATPGFRTAPSEKKVRGVANAMAKDGQLTMTGDASERNYYPN